MRVILAALLVVAAGCAFTTPFECDDANWQPGLSCERVLAAAREQLDDTSGITRLTAVQGIHCPPAPAGCPFTPFVVTVYAELVDGSSVYVSVHLEDDGSLRAQPRMAVERVP